MASDILIMAGLGLSPYARLDIALLALIGYHALTIQSLVWNAVAGEHRISGAVFGPTELRIALIAMNVASVVGGAPKGFLGYAGLSWCDALMLAARGHDDRLPGLRVHGRARPARQGEGANRDQRP